MLSLLLANRKLLLIGIISILFLSLVGAYKYQSYQIQKYKKEIESYKITVDSQKKVIEQYQIDTAKLQKFQKILLEKERKISEINSKLLSNLNTINILVDKDPTTAENIINQAFVERKRCFELATGASILNKETNSVCPHLVE